MNSSLPSSAVLHTGTNRPFFSVIMCTYNRAAFLPRALDSLVAQTERDWELIVVDDGSTDETIGVVQKYAASGLPCRLIWHTNRGTGVSRNAGIMASCGLFLTFLDSDDAYAPDHLHSRKQILLEYPSVEFIHGGVTVIGEQTVADRHDPSRKIPVSECVVGGTFVIRRDALFRLGGFDAVRYADDALLYERAYSEGITIARTDHPSYTYYRDTPDSLCSTYGT